MSNEKNMTNKDQDIGKLHTINYDDVFKENVMQKAKMKEKEVQAEGIALNYLYMVFEGLDPQTVRYLYLSIKSSLERVEENRIELVKNASIFAIDLLGDLEEKILHYTEDDDDFLHYTEDEDSDEEVEVHHGTRTDSIQMKQISDMYDGMKDLSMVFDKIPFNHKHSFIGSIMEKYDKDSISAIIEFLNDFTAEIKSKVE